MSAGSHLSWKHPALGCTNGVTSPVRHQMTANPRGRRARQLAWRRYHNAVARNLPAKLPVWCGPKPLPQGQGNSQTIPSGKVEKPTNHGGTARKVVAACS